MQAEDIFLGTRVRVNETGAEGSVVAANDRRNLLLVNCGSRDNCHWLQPHQFTIEPGQRMRTLDDIKARRN